MLAGALLLAFVLVNTAISTSQQRRLSPGTPAEQIRANFPASLRAWQRTDSGVGIYDTALPPYVVPAGFYPYSLLSLTVGKYIDVPHWNVGSKMLVMQGNGVLTPGRVAPIASATAENIRLSGTVTRTDSAGARLGCFTGGTAGGDVGFDLDRTTSAGLWFIELTSEGEPVSGVRSVYAASGGKSPSVVYAASAPATDLGTTAAIPLPPLPAFAGVVLTLEPGADLCLDGIAVGPPTPSS